MGKSTINETKQRAYKSVCARSGRKAKDQQAKAAKKIASNGNLVEICFDYEISYISCTPIYILI